MADKEEMIVFCRTMDYTVTPTDKGRLFNGNISSQNCIFMTRQEAIAIMAKAICETGAPNTWGLIDEDYKRFCLAEAKSTLNALLGVEK